MQEYVFNAEDGEVLGVERAEKLLKVLRYFYMEIKYYVEMW